MTRFLFLIPLLMVTMGIGPCGSRRLGSLDAGGGSLDAGGSCEYAGIHREAGSSFPSTDGCNTCSCGILTAGQLVEAGKVYCTQAMCLSDAGGSGDLGADTDSDTAAAPLYSACQFGSGIGRALIAKRDATRNLCVVLILDRPGTNAFGLSVPPGWGVEAAFAAPGGLDCEFISPPAGAVLASAATGTVTITNAVVDVNAMLTFPPNSLGVALENLVASALDSGRTCSGSIGPAPAVDGAVDSGGATTSGTLRLDCGSRLDQIPEFDTRCQMVGADIPMMICRQIQNSSGSLVVRVLQPSAVVLGQPIPLGANGVVSIELAVITPTLLVETLSPNGTGSIVLDQFSIGGPMRGHFVNAQVQVAPTPVFTCQLSGDEFIADSGPGITSDAGGQ